MAEKDDIRKIVEELLKEGTARQQQLSQEEESRLRSLLKDYTDINQLQKELNDLINKGKKNYEDIGNKIKIAKENKDSLVDDEQIILELQEEQTQQLKNQFQINQKAYLQVLEQIKAKEKIVENGGKEAEQAKKDLEYLKEKEKILKDITFEQGRDLEKAEKEKKLKEGILSIGKEIWQVSKQYGSELEKHIITISKSNGGYAELLSNLREAGRLSQAATLGTGITGEENMRALEALSDGFIGLTTYSAQSISNMQVATAQLTKIGVSSGMAAKSFDSLVNAMGKTPEQAKNIQDSFVQMAAKNRLALGSVTQAFAENSSRFVGYGEKMTKVLDGLAEQSLKTGVAMNKLVGIAQQFDTFEGAARAVGNLNALLGGDYLNSIELLTASDDERIRLLKEGVAASGLQWESMNRFQKMAIANAAGISDLNEAAKIFGETSLQNTKQQAESAEVQKALAEQAASVSLGMDKLKSTLNGLFIALDPLISAFRFLVDILVFLPNQVSKIGGTFGQFASALTSITIGIGVLAFKNKLFGGSFGFVSRGVNGLIKKLGELIAKKKATDIAMETKGFGGIAKWTDPTKAAASVGPAAPAGPGKFTSFINNIKPGNMLAAAGALLLFAGALLALGFALQQFAVFAGMKENKASAITIAIGSIGALIGISFLLQKVSPQISSGLIVLAIMSASLLLLGVALQMFSKVDWKLVAGIGVIILGLGLAIAGIGMIMSGIGGMGFALGILAIIGMSIALTKLGNSLKLIVDSIEKTAPALTTLTDSFKLLLEIKDLDKNITSIKTFLSDLTSIDVSPINNLANAIGGLAENLQKLASLSPEMSMSVTGNAKINTTEQLNAAAQITTQASKVISSTVAAQTQTQAQQTPTFVPVPVTIEMDKTVIGRILDIEGIAKGTAKETISSLGMGAGDNTGIQALLKAFGTTQ